jgi:metallophosphoesterase superfamily enzyme
LIRNTNSNPQIQNQITPRNPNTKMKASCLSDLISRGDEKHTKMGTRNEERKRRRLIESADGGAPEVTAEAAVKP